MKKTLVMALGILMLCSCTSHYASNGDKGYQDSHNGKRLQVPPPLSSVNLSHFYELPPPAKKATVASVVPPTQHA